MAHGIEKLSALRVGKLTKKPGMHGDGGGLWLCVSSTSAASWVFRYSLAGEAHEMGLGPLRDVSLSEARDRATAARRLKAAGVDPIAERERVAATARLEKAKAITFKDAAKQYIAAHKAGWKNAVHAKQWPQTLEAYAYPIIGDLPVAAVDVGLVTQVLQGIWSTKSETASRLRGRIEQILDWATVRGYRTGENPARWRGHLQKLFPTRAKVRATRHHPALPYAELPKFMAALGDVSGEAARALKFVILTAARTGDVIGATGREIDRAKAVWTIPAARMKAGREHRVPLSQQAVSLLPNHLGTGPIFTSARSDGALSNMSLLMTLRRMGLGGLTVHGFRSSFRDWAAEATDYPAEMAEMALAHAVGDRVEAAYRRGDLFMKRVAMMQAWADFCCGGAP